MRAMRASGAVANVAAVVAAVSVLMTPAAARAEFRGKGSVVGRILSESIAEAEDPVASPTPQPLPISRESLNALMKHPTEPDFDPLRPMSGRWVRCQGVVQATRAEPAGTPCTHPGCTPNNPVAETNSVQDRYSSSDRSHFTHTVVSASDKECKTIVSEDRTTYECSPSLECKIVKRELRTGAAAWAPVKLGEHEPSMKLSFVGVQRPGKRHKKKSAVVADPRHLELRIERDGAEAESVRLDFVPTTPHSHKD